MKVLVIDATHGGLMLSEAFSKKGHEVTCVDVYKTLKQSDIDEYSKVFQIRREMPSYFDEYDLIVAPIHYPLHDEGLKGKVVTHYEAVKIGVFMDAAFSFYYHENLELLRRMNAEIVPINSLPDERVGDDLAGLLIGGHPEVFAKELKENQSLRSSIKKRASDKMPILSEGGGLTYLCGSMTYSGKIYKMAEVFDGMSVSPTGS